MDKFKGFIAIIRIVVKYGAIIGIIVEAFTLVADKIEALPENKK